MSFTMDMTCLRCGKTYGSGQYCFCNSTLVNFPPVNKNPTPGTAIKTGTNKYPYTKNKIISITIRR